MMIEALAAILIFSLGILAMMGLQASSVKLSSDAKYSSDASLFANQRIWLMWVSDRTPATLQANFQGANGAAYTAWVNDVVAALPGVNGVAANQPIVSIVTQNPVATATSVTALVTITIFWKSPNEKAVPGTTLCGVTTTAATHCYIAMAQII